MKQKLANYYDKNYFKEYARFILNELYNLKRIHRTERYKIDRLDLISNNVLIGIEVTQFINEKEAKKR